MEESNSNTTSSSTPFLFNFETESSSNDSKFQHRIDEFKSRNTMNQEKRRQDMLNRQKTLRRDLTELARKLVISDSEPPKETVEQTSTSQETMEVFLESDEQQKKNENSMELDKKEREQELEARRTKFYANQLMLPEFMSDVPSNLIGGWYVVPFPQGGVRCIVISSMGLTTARGETGILLKRFSSGLPNGSSWTKESFEHYCLLDCVFHEPSSTFYVLDLMAWKGYLYYDCASDFRFFWKMSKLQEVPVNEISSRNQYKFIPLPFYECDSASLRGIKTSTMPFKSEGLVFYNKETHYVLGLTPLVCTLGMNFIDSLISKLKV